MRAVVIHEHGGTEVLKIEEVPDPTCNPDGVVLEVKAVGLNHLDTWVRRGIDGHTFPLPLIPGCDFSGVVTEVGKDVSGIQVGDKILAAPGLSCGHCRECTMGQDQLCHDYGILGETVNGGCSEKAALPATNAIPLPEGLSFEEAAAFPLTFLTAWHMLVARCDIQKGMDVLVHAAGSGVGSAAVQIARLFEARVIATASTDEKLEKAKQLGADIGINYEQTDWTKEVRSITNKRGVDIVFEHVGEKTISDSIRCLAKGGKVVTCGATTGPKLEANLQMIFFKSLSILGSTMGSRDELYRLVDLVGRGLLHPVIDRVLPLEDVAKAHDAMAKREQFGKIILIP